MYFYQAIPEYGPNDKGGVILVLDPDTGEAQELDPRLDLLNMSPTGFAWGYLGSGPAQTALAILADASNNDDLAFRHYQAFKEQVIVHQLGRWTLPDAFVQGWLDGAEAKRKIREGLA